MTIDMAEGSGLALLPTGLMDVLPLDAAFEAGVVQRLLSVFGASGYDQVSPPLVEFEDSFLNGAGAAVGRETFRLMDPVSQRMMVVRSDITPQVARIATTRLVRAPRPLRLAYAGQVLVVKGSQLRPRRQFRQAGCELIGSEAVTADAEVLLLAADALQELGIAGLTIDLNLPTLVPAVCGALGFAGDELVRLKAALDRKDAAGVADIAGGRSGPLLGLMQASGPVDQSLERLAKLDLPPDAVAARDHFAAIAALVRREAPDLTLTVDTVEHRGFEYHTATSFTIFVRGGRGELGRGGRYLAGQGDTAEPAVGFTLFLDAVQRALRPPPAPARLFLPFGTNGAERRRWQADGWTTLAGLETTTNAPAEARRLGCTHLLAGGRAESVEGAD